MLKNVLDLCEKAAQHWELNLNSEKDQRKIAQNILQLSDFFITSPNEATPWAKTWAQQAYVFYYLPLNSIRVARVLNHIQKDLHQLDLKKVIDFGAGLASASRLLINNRYDLQLIEHEQAPQDIVRKFDVQAEKYSWSKNPPSKHEVQSQPTLSCFSYSLTELKELPAWAWESRALLIIEPSTQQDGRKLLELREKLIAGGYHILAPCTHQLACPLLHHSKSDWCHDRVHTDLPEWMRKMEEYLPMKNRTLTVSYLFAVEKRHAPKNIYTASTARVTGDLLKEKGKDRQLFCRGSEREFLAWMHKNGEHQEIPRGVLINLPENLQKVSNELRVPAECKLPIQN